MKKLQYCLFGNRMHKKCHTNVLLTDQKLYVCVCVCVCVCVLGHQLFNSNRVRKPFNLLFLIYSITEVLNCNINHSNNAKNVRLRSLCLFFSSKRKFYLSLKLFSLFKTFFSLYELFFLFKNLFFSLFQNHCINLSLSYRREKNIWRQNVLEKNMSERKWEKILGLRKDKALHYYYYF